ncbi:L-gulono-1,4-lactone dehydrogenase [Thalassocella blandensis]|nr:L-gulono-1,4-lactone dehydrogenase [Thalassocella blandensis]
MNNQIPRPVLMVSKIAKFCLPVFASCMLSACLWENVARTETVEPEYLTQPVSADELVEFIGMATENNKRVRMTGSGHSHSDVAITQEVLFTPEKLNKPLTLDRSRLRNPDDVYIARTQSGITIEDLNNYLDTQGMALFNMGGYDGQTIAGVMMTATHGSGRDYGPIADQVLSMQVVGEGGVMYQIEPADGITDPAVFPGTLEENSEIPVQLIQEDDAFNAMRVSIGSMGVVYSVTLRTDKKFWLREVRTRTSWSELKAPGGYLEKLLNNEPVYSDRPSPEHIEFQYTPYAQDGDHSFLITERYRSYEPLPEQPQSQRGTPGTEFVSGLITLFEMPLVQILNKFPGLAKPILEQSLISQEDDNFTNVSYDVFDIGIVNYTDAIAIEVALDVEDTIAAVERTFSLAEQLFNENKIPHTGPISIRFVKQSDAMIAMQQGRDTMFIEIIMLQGVTGIRDLMLTYEQTFMEEFGARPHWGLDLKVLQGSEWLETLYPRWDDWLVQYRRFNHGTFDGKVTDRLGISVVPR